MAKANILLPQTYLQFLNSRAAEFFTPAHNVQSDKKLPQILKYQLKL